MAEKGIRSVWIDSDSVGVLGTKVYRDDVLIATVPIGTQFYNDPTAVVGVEYKYEVQAYTSASESTDEIEGTNMDYYTIVEIGDLKPIMMNFRTDETNKNRIYFDTPIGSVDGIDYQDFTIDGKAIDAVNTTDNYFTLSADLNYWDNILIRKEAGNSNGCYDFTLQRITNEITLPESGTIKYVAEGAGGLGDSTSDPMSWQDAQNVSQDTTVYWKAGNYGGINFVQANEGSLAQPIQHIGYRDTPGDSPTLNRRNLIDGVDQFDPDEMPLLQDGTNESIAIDLRDYVILKNFQIDDYKDGYCVYVHGVNYAIVENIYERDTKFGTWSNSNTNEHIRVIGGLCLNIDKNPVKIGGQYILYNDVWAVSTIIQDQDYYITLKGGTYGRSNCMYRCRVEKVENDTHHGHGLSFKSDQYDDGLFLQYNLMEDCFAVNDNIEIRHEPTNNNVIRNVEVSNTTPGQTTGIVSRDGAHHNTYENIKAIGVSRFHYWYETVEHIDGEEYSHGNKFINCIVDGADELFYAAAASGVTGDTLVYDNHFINCTFKNVTDIYNNSNVNFNNTNTIKNCLFDSCANLGSGDLNAVFDFNLFWNGFTAQGTNTITGVDPDLDANYKPQAIGIVVAPRIDGAFYDYDENERDITTTVGSIKSDEEIGGEVPPSEITNYVFDGALDANLAELTGTLLDGIVNQTFVIRVQITGLAHQHGLLGLNDSTQGLKLERDAADNKCDGNLSDTGTSAFTNATTAIDGTWENLFFFYDGASIGLYAGDVNVRETADPDFTGRTPGHQLAVGVSLKGGGVGTEGNLIGKISDVQFYNKRLSVAEIAALNIDLTDTATGLVANFAGNKQPNEWTSEIGGYVLTNQGGVTYDGETPPVEDYDFYVSEDGTGDGLTEGSPMSFADSQTAINSMTSGQSIAYKGGDEFFGQLTINSRTNITITSYGTGRAIIKGSKDITGWTEGDTNIWSVSTGADDALQVFKNGSNLLNARMPKIAAKETPSNSYYNVTEIYGVSNRFLSTDLIDLGLSVGSTVTISSREWALESREITAFNNTTGEVTFTPDAKYDIEVGANFYVNNDEVLLTEQDEWRYDSNTLYMYSTSQPTGISISTVDGDAITITNSDNITFDDIAIKDFNNNAFEVDSSDNLTLNDLELDYNYMQAANVVNSTNFTMTNCIVTGSNQEVITIDGTSHDANIAGNEFIDCGVLKNITSKDVYQPNGIYSAGDRLNLELNTYRNIGYLGIFWIGADSTITKNIFEDYCQALEDGGGVYSHNGDWANVGATGSIASNNMCISTAFTDGWLSHGLYTDERCHDIIFRDNTVINGRYGAYLHNNKRIEHDGNNFYNQNDYGIHIKEDANGGEGETVDNSIHDNYIFEIDPVVECAFYRSSYDIPASGIFGTYNNNAYWNPRYSSLDTIVLANSATQFLTLSEWQGLSGQDLNSTTNPSLWTGSEQSQIVYNATNEVAVKSLTGTWYDLDGTQYVNEITLQPFTSSILISEDLAPPVDNLITNGDFEDGSTGWTLQAGWTIGSDGSGGNSANCNTSGTDYIFQDVGLIQGETYEITYDVLNFSSGQIRVEVSSTEFGEWRTENGTYTESFTPTASTSNRPLWRNYVGGGFVGSIDNIVVVKIS